MRRSANKIEKEEEAFKDRQCFKLRYFADPLLL
jgi:hypothetical protein